ncbi:MAG: CIA30 family protein [Phycisphaerales bacterium]|nr:CIA30 family protein [Phycisphaerales bacterium]
MMLLAAVLGSSLLAAPADSIAGVAASSDQLKTLVAAASAADLVELLDTSESLTVFAPTDDAFSAIDASTLNSLLEEPGTPTLKRILAHHVVAGSVRAGDLVGVESVETLAGTTLPVAIVQGRVLIGNAVVEMADIEADNGVVHVIDRVLLPPAQEPALVRYLASAVERGVPVFNDGNEGACADIYATAVEALVLSNGWDLSSEERSYLARTNEEASSMTSDRDRAWAYRRIIDDLLRPRLDGTKAASNVRTPSNEYTLLDFEQASEGKAWQVVLDGVMGGLSTGKVEIVDGSMVFTGETSLRNNGGFSSIRRGLPEGAMQGRDSLRLRVRGDGRTWIVGTRKSRRMGADSFWTRFDTRDGEWMTIDVPVRDMERHYYGNRIAGSIDPDEVAALEFYMYDKKAGPFRLEVAEIEAVNEEELIASR